MLANRSAEPTSERHLRPVRQCARLPRTLTVPIVAELLRSGVWIEHATGATDRPPLILVHGGGHASWCWHRVMPALVAAGWECLRFDWYGHGRSAAIGTEMLLRRSIGDVAQEIDIVVGAGGRPPVLVGQSMGAAASLAYASAHSVAALVLLTPVVVAGLGAVPLDMPIEMDRPFGPPRFPQARRMFFPGVPEDAALRYWTLMCPESPVAVRESTRWDLDVDLARVHAPALVIAGGSDVLCPPETVRLLAVAIGAEFVELAGCGHDDLLLSDHQWPSAVAKIEEWLGRRFSSP
jgi:pimeloyl-ACP methyl ester carboxylesterase